MSELSKLRIVLDTRSDVSPREHLPTRNVHTASKVISSKKVRGAFLTTIRRMICPYHESKRCINCDQRDSCEFPNEVIPALVSAGPALPRCDCEEPRELENPPATYLTCKLCSEADEVHDATDSFLTTDDISQAEYCTTHTESYYRVQFKGSVCLSCGKPLKEPWIAMRPSVGINSTTGSAEQGELYFSQTVSYPAALATEITVKSNKLQNYVTELETDTELLQLGAGRSRGWGIVEINNIEKETSEKEFIEQKASAIADCVEQYGGFVVIAKTGIASLLESEDGYRSVPRVDNIMGAELAKAFGRTMSFSGWSLMTNLQKPRIRTARPGSVFFYEVDDPDSFDYQALARKELTGIGQEIMINSQLNQIVFWEGR